MRHNWIPWIVLIAMIALFFGENVLSIVGIVEPPSDPYQGGWIIQDVNNHDNNYLSYGLGEQGCNAGPGPRICFRNCLTSVAGMPQACFSSIPGVFHYEDALTDNSLIDNALDGGSIEVKPGFLDSDGTSLDPAVGGHAAVPTLPEARSARIISKENLFDKEWAVNIYAGPDYRVGISEEENCQFGTAVNILSTYIFSVNRIEVVKDEGDPRIYSVRVNGAERCRFIPNTNEIHLAALSTMNAPSNGVQFENMRIYKAKAVEEVIIQTTPETITSLTPSSPVISTPSIEKVTVLEPVVTTEELVQRGEVILDVKTESGYTLLQPVKETFIERVTGLKTLEFGIFILAILIILLGLWWVISKR